MKEIYQTFLWASLTSGGRVRTQVLVLPLCSPPCEVSLGPGTGWLASQILISFLLDDTNLIFASSYKFLIFKYCINSRFLVFVQTRLCKPASSCPPVFSAILTFFLSWPFLYPSRSLGIPSTFSPISARSPPGSTSKSCRRAQASRICWYLFSSNSDPKRMLSFMVPFCIQDCWGT